jgi:uncharacterized membrane protein
MIFGRPTNLWLALVTAVLTFAQVVLVNIVPRIDAATVATILGSLGGVFAVAIALIANQPPVISSGDTVTVLTPKGQPDRKVTIS